MALALWAAPAHLSSRRPRGLAPGPAAYGPPVREPVGLQDKIRSGKSMCVRQLQGPREPLVFSLWRAAVPSSPQRPGEEVQHSLALQKVPNSPQRMRPVLVAGPSSYLGCVRSHGGPLIGLSLCHSLSPRWARLLLRSPRRRTENSGVRPRAAACMPDGLTLTEPEAALLG